MKLCKICDSIMVWNHPQGHLMESPNNIKDWSICRECMVEHCGFTNCHGCEYGKYPNCRFFEMKKQLLQSLQSQQV